MKILIAGDYYTGNNIKCEALEKDLERIKPLCDNADYSIVNFESPISSKWDAPIIKCGPCLKTNEVAASILKNIGFDCLTLANNHILDQGEKTLLHTINKCRKIGFDIVGVGKDANEANKILYKKISGKKLAIINCCEHEFSIADENKAGANPLNPIQQYYAILEARKNSDYVFVIVHGGHEQFQLPSPRMQEVYRFFIEAGADVVINHHQHCYSGYEFFKGKPIFYGLGNFYFPKEKLMPDEWYKGILLEIDINEPGDIKVQPYLINFQNNKIEIFKSDKEFENKICQFNSIISNPLALKKNHTNWMALSRKAYKSLLLPYSNKFLVALWKRKLFPSLISKKKIKRLINYISCEAHRDRLLDSLNSK